MRLTIALCATAALIAVQGCTTAGSDATSTADDATTAVTAASATLADAGGATKATATLRQESGGLRVAITASGMAPGTYAFHLHTTGKCEGPEFTTAGGHWNPTAKQHGRDNPAGQHFGDLPNLTVGTDGQGTVEAEIAGGMLTGGTTPLLDADGASVMLHAKPDDYKTDPAGNAGGRIACGVVTAG